jgi:hypothetical protein
MRRLATQRNDLFGHLPARLSAPRRFAALRGAPRRNATICLEIYRRRATQRNSALRVSAQRCASQRNDRLAIYPRHAPHHCVTQRTTAHLFAPRRNATQRL